jgi:acyl-lipid omega-6 desaturase (Delta-12 desaturase)
MMSDPESAKSAPSTPQPEWKEIVLKYQRPALKHSLWQLINTLVPYVGLWVLMYVFLNVSWWLTAACAVLAGGFLIRVFIIFHDCGHGSFFRSHRANHVVGVVTGLLCLTPFAHWRWEHAAHHATAGDLDRRGTGDVWTMTVKEYLEAPRWKRLAYRFARNPIVLFVIAPAFLFLVKQRFPSTKAPSRERRSVHWTTLAVVAMVGGLSCLFGLTTFLVLQMIILMVGGTAGVWLFYVQHQFEGVYWEKSSDWDFYTAAIQGSSFYKLPRVLQWFSGNIGFHHIHHLSPRIPNYNLPKCHRAEPLFQTVKPVTLLASFKSLTFRLWDEQRNRLVGYRAALKRPLAGRS